MSELAGLVHSPSHIVYVYLALWALSALAHTMPAPDGKSSKAYQWVYNLLQFLLANLGRIQSSILKPPEPSSAEDARAVIERG